MKISIITTFKDLNKSQFISNINSVRKQNYKNLEHLINYAGNNQSDFEYIKKFINKNIKIFWNKDKNIYEGINNGIKLSSGIIIGILNLDDVFFNNFVLSDVCSKFKENINIDGVYGNLIQFQGPLAKKKIYKVYKVCQYSFTDFFYGSNIPHPTFFLKKTIFIKLGNYNTSFKIASDYEFIIRCFKHKLKIIYLDKYMVWMRVGGLSTKNFKNKIIIAKEDFEICKKYFKFPLFTIFLKKVKSLRFYFKYAQKSFF